MANAKTGIWSAVGAVVGGVVGAAAGYYAAEMRPRVRRGGGSSRSEDIEDAMTIGGASGAVLGAFIGGTVGGEAEAQPVAYLAPPPPVR